MNRICGQYSTYPDLTSDRALEAGLRLDGHHKSSKPGAPLVSIITVVLNAEETVERTLRSIGNQTYSNIEHIVIDGGSTDQTLDVVSKYAKRIDYILSEPDTGIYDAMNKGLSLAQGDYINFLNADDWFNPDTVTESIFQIKGGGYDGCCSKAQMYDAHETPSWIFPALPFNDAAFLTRMPCQHQTAFLSSEVYNKIGYFDTSYRIAADLKSLYQVIQHRFRIKCIDKILVNVSLGGLSIQQHELSMEEAYSIAENYTLLTAKEHRIIADFLFDGKVPDDQQYFKKLIAQNKLTTYQLNTLRYGQSVPDTSKID